MYKSTVILAIILSLPATLTAQITINRDDMPNVGDTIRRSYTASANGIDYTLTGLNHSWDFSSLGRLSQRVDTFRSVGSSPLIYQLVFNGIFDPNKATICTPLGNTDSLTGLSLQNVYAYFRETASSFSFLGLGAYLGTVPLTIKYNNPDIWYNFPLAAGSMDSSTSSYSLGLSGLGYFLTSRKRVNHVDGWGTLTTPFGTYPVIRVKSVVNEYDSLWSDSLQTGGAISRLITEYKWLGDNFGLPLLEITAEGTLLTVLYRDVYHPPGYTLSGALTYDNNISTGLSNTVVVLKNAVGNIIAADTTNALGLYAFNEVPDGSYALEPVITKPWGGCNANDSFLALKHFVGLDTLAGLRATAADVDNTGFVNSVDALLISRRFVGMQNSFITGDWILPVENVTVSGAAVIRNIKTLCYGDVDGSYIP